MRFMIIIVNLLFNIFVKDFLDQKGFSVKHLSIDKPKKDLANHLYRLMIKNKKIKIFFEFVFTSLMLFL